MKNTIKEKMAAGEVCLGTWYTVRSIEVVEALASIGFDWLAVDMEHGSADVADVKTAVIACERHGCAPMVRMPSADPILARRLLDAGAHGLLVPGVDDARAFAAFAAHCLYPPDGRRGVALERFNRWGDDFEDYMRTFGPVIVPMIESRKGIAAARDIAALPVVDALFFGPYDLSADLGTPGDFETPEFHAALDGIREACRAAGKPMGGHQVEPSETELRKRIEAGFTFVAYGTDVIAMRHALGAAREYAASRRH